MAHEWHIGPTMASARLGRVVVTVHGAKNPGDAEWCAYLEWIQQLDVPLGNLRTLVRSLGGGPNALQRGQLTEVVGRAEIKPKAVLLTDSLVVRGIGIAVAWFNVSIRVMAPHQLDAAFQYLELDPAEAAEAQQLLNEAGERLEQESRGVGT